LHSLASILLALSLVSACSYREQVKTMPTHLADKRVHIRTTDGRTRPALAEATPTGLVLRDDQGHLIPSSDVTEVSTVSHLRGTLEGLLLGLTAGIATGMVLGALAPDSTVANIYPTDCPTCFSARDKMIILAAIGAPIGTLTGLVIGAGRGTRFTYQLPAKQTQKVHLAGPPGSIAGLSWTF
jgi:hypothetical protein